MTETPQPPERPEDEGIPDYAADTSTAYDEADRPRLDDSPPALPADEPQAVDEFGVTGQEGRQGEPIADRLDREEPDIGAEERYASPGPRLAGEAVGESAAGQVARDAEVLGTEPEPAAGGGAVSEYDTPESGRQAGRLVEPDEGARVDDEKDVVAADVGDAGGGLAAEEAAMHEVTEDEAPP